MINLNMAIQKHLLPCSVCSLHSEGEKNICLGSSNIHALDRNTVRYMMKLFLWGFGPAFLGVFMKSEEIHENSSLS